MFLLGNIWGLGFRGGGGHSCLCSVCVYGVKDRDCRLRASFGVRELGSFLLRLSCCKLEATRIGSWTLNPKPLTLVRVNIACT